MCALISELPFDISIMIYGFHVVSFSKFGNSDRNTNQFPPVTDRQGMGSGNFGRIRVIKELFTDFTWGGGGSMEPYPAQEYGSHFPVSVTVTVDLMLSRIGLRDRTNEKRLK